MRRPSGWCHPPRGNCTSALPNRETTCYDIVQEGKSSRLIDTLTLQWSSLKVISRFQAPPHGHFGPMRCTCVLPGCGDRTTVLMIEFLQEQFHRATRADQATQDSVSRKIEAWQVSELEGLEPETICQGRCRLSLFSDQDFQPSRVLNYCLLSPLCLGAFPCRGLVVLSSLRNPPKISDKISRRNPNRSRWTEIWCSSIWYQHKI